MWSQIFNGFSNWLLRLFLFLCVCVDSHASWFEEVIQLNPNTSLNSAAGTYPNVSFDENNQIHLTHDQQVYSVKINDAWVNQSLDLGYLETTQLNISFMSDGSKHFFYGDDGLYNNPDMHVRLDDSGVQVIYDYLPINYESDSPPLTIIDLYDNIHLVYLNTNTWSVVYASNSSGVWVLENIYSINYTDNEKNVFTGRVLHEDLSYALDFYIDENNNITVAFVEWHYASSGDTTADLIKLHKSNNNASWISSVVTEKDGNNHWDYPDIKIDRSHDIHMVYSYRACLGFCYPRGIEYGTNKSGSWLTKTISSESFYYDDPDHSYLDAYWITGLSSNISINDNNEIMITYAHGALDRSATNMPAILSELRAVKLDDCMPVSFIVYDQLVINHNLHVLPITAYYNGGLSNNGLGVIAFHDEENGDARILTEEKGISVKSCAISDDSIHVEVKNIKSNNIQFQNTNTLGYLNNIYTNILDGCSNTLLLPNESCYIDVNINLSESINDLDNTDSTLYLGLQHLNESEQESWFVIETNSLRPAITTNSSNSSSNNSSGGVVNPFVLFILFLYRTLRKCGFN